MRTGLGKILSETIERQERDAAEAERRRIADEERKRLEARNDIEGFIKKLTDHLTQGILNGSVPSRKVESWDRQKWLDKARKGEASNQDIWDNFVETFRSNGIAIGIVNEHDGMGVKSWYRITVQPIQEGK